MMVTGLNIFYRISTKLRRQLGLGLFVLPILCVLVWLYVKSERLDDATYKIEKINLNDVITDLDTVSKNGNLSRLQEKGNREEHTEGGGIADNNDVSDFKTNTIHHSHNERQEDTIMGEPLEEDLKESEEKHDNDTNITNKRKTGGENVKEEPECQVFPITSCIDSDHQTTTIIDTSCLYGKCITGLNHTLMYNRVPKCGSRTLNSLIEIMARRHGYQTPKEIDFLQGANLEVEQKLNTDKIRKRICHAPDMSVLQGHIYFIDFSRDELVLPHKRPIYLNIIRDPFDLLVSRYYFSRFGDDKYTDTDKLHKRTKPGYINESFNECVTRDREECIGPHVQIFIVKFFCGFNPECQVPTEGALEKAKQNLDKYVVVGVAEEYEDFLKVLEKLLPDYFGELLIEYNSPAEKKREEKTKSKGKEPVTPEVKERMKALLELDYKFYNHTRKRFHELKRRLEI